ncbi:MAG: putative hydrolase, family [Candidatus Saccharibacteria bacterium]|nr:putative hydrolase, family [Candidatus Saccharibacteria bacterium]
MKNSRPRNKWKVLSRFTTITTPWLTLIGERLLDDNNTELEYWRVEKADGALIITIHNGKLILPRPMYRPGKGERTLDFCGGRASAGQPMDEAARKTVVREFGITQADVQIDVTPLNNVGWDVDSSFTNVKMYGYVVTIPADVSISPDNIGAQYALNEEGYNQLLDELTCMQCRMLFHEWRLKDKK